MSERINSAAGGATSPKASRPAVPPSVPWPAVPALAHPAGTAALAAAGPDGAGPDAGLFKLLDEVRGRTSARTSWLSDCKSFRTERRWRRPRL